MDFFYVILIVGMILFLLPWLWPIINWKKTSEKINNQRIKVIEGKIEAIGGKVVKIEKTRKSEYPYASELEDDGTIYVCYRVSYMLGVAIKETWCVFNLRSNVIIV